LLTRDYCYLFIAKIYTFYKKVVNLQDVLSRSERAFAESKNAEQKESEGGKS